MNNRRMASVVAVLALVLATAVPALAQSTEVIERAAEELRSDPVYIDEAAQVAPTGAEVEELRAAIDDVDEQTGPIYVAVLPESAGSPQATIEALAESLAREGTYIQILGTNLQIGSTEGTPIGRETADAVADAALAEYDGDTAGPLLLDVVGRLEAAASGESITGPDRGGRGMPLLLPGVLVVLVLGGAFVFFRARRARRERERERLEEVRPTVLEDLAGLYAASEELDMDLRLANPSRETKQDALTAVESYARASPALWTRRSGSRTSRPQRLRSRRGCMRSLPRAHAWRDASLPSGACPASSTPPRAKRARRLMGTARRPAA